MELRIECRFLSMITIHDIYEIHDMREKERKRDKSRVKERKGERKEKKMLRVNHYQSAFNSQFSIPWWSMMFHDVPWFSMICLLVLLFLLCLLFLSPSCTRSGTEQDGAGQDWGTAPCKVEFFSFYFSCSYSSYFSCKVEFFSSSFSSSASSPDLSSLCLFSLNSSFWLLPPLQGIAPCWLLPFLLPAHFVPSFRLQLEEGM